MQIDTILQCSSGSTRSPILHLDPIFYQQCKPLHNWQAPSGRLKKWKIKQILAPPRSQPQIEPDPAWRQAAAALAPVLLPLEQGDFRKPATKSNKRKIKGLNKRKSPLLHLAWHHPHPIYSRSDDTQGKSNKQGKSPARRRPSRWGESNQTPSSMNSNHKYITYAIKS